MDDVETFGNVSVLVWALVLKVEDEAYDNVTFQEGISLVNVVTAGIEITTFIRRTTHVNVKATRSLEAIIWDQTLTVVIFAQTNVRTKHGNEIANTQAVLGSSRIVFAVLENFKPILYTVGNYNNDDVFI